MWVFIGWGTKFDFFKIFWSSNCQKQRVFEHTWTKQNVPPSYRPATTVVDGTTVGNEQAVLTRPTPMWTVPPAPVARLLPFKATRPASLAGPGSGRHRPRRGR
jgi:hypothetical protein